MTGPPSSSFCLLRFVFSGTALPFGAGPTAGFTTPSGPPQEVLDDISEQIGALVVSMCSDFVSLDEVQLKIGPEASGPTYTSVGPGAGDQGTSASPQTALLIRKPLTALSQRYSGRMYWPGVPDAALSNSGILDSTYVEDSQLLLTAFLEYLETTHDMDPTIYPAEGSDPRFAAGWQLMPRVGTQRRRNRR